MIKFKLEECKNKMNDNVENLNLIWAKIKKNIIQSLLDLRPEVSVACTSVCCRRHWGPQPQVCLRKNNQ